MVKNMIKYRLTWKFTDDGKEQKSYFWLPEEADPNQYVSDILNAVELLSSEYGYEYQLDKE